MGPPKLYQSLAERKAAKKANYDRYYKKHQDAINARHRSRYAQDRSTAPKAATAQSILEEKCNQLVLNAPKTSSKSVVPSTLASRSKKRCDRVAKPSPIPSSMQHVLPDTTLLPTLTTASSRTKDVPCKTPSVRRVPVHEFPATTSMRERSSSPCTSVSLRLAKQSVEALFDNYVAGLGGSWPGFFDKLSTSFIASGNSEEINEAFDKYKRTVVVMEKRYHALQDAAVMAGDYASMEEGRGMLDRMKEVGAKLLEFYRATMHGNEDFEEQVNAGNLTW